MPFVRLIAQNAWLMGAHSIKNVYLIVAGDTISVREGDANTHMQIKGGEQVHM